MRYLKDTFGEPDAPKYPHIVVVDQTKAKDKVHVLEMLDDVQNKGGEGLMLRRPES
jgi:DNA ligase 1